MSVVRGEPCPKCGFAPLLRYETRGTGHAVETVLEECECRRNRERKRQRLCRRCPASIAHRPVRAIYCEPCAEKRSREVLLAYKNRNRDRIRVQQREYAKRAYRADPEAHRQRDKEWKRKNRDRLLAEARAKRRWGHPDYEANLARTRELKRKWRKNNPEKVKAQRRRHAAKQKAKREREAAARTAPTRRAA